MRSTRCSAAARRRATPPEPRLAAGILVGALIRAVEAAGGTATVLAKGDATAGALLLVLAERGVTTAVIERAPSWAGGAGWIAAGPTDPSEPGALAEYLARRRRSDPDLWAVEVDAIDARPLVERVLAPG